jgi:hypothetical protein
MYKKFKDLWFNKLILFSIFVENKLCPHFKTNYKKKYDAETMMLLYTLWMSLKN